MQENLSETDLGIFELLIVLFIYIIL